MAFSTGLWSVEQTNIYYIYGQSYTSLDKCVGSRDPGLGLGEDNNAQEEDGDLHLDIWFCLRDRNSETCAWRLLGCTQLHLSFYGSLQRLGCCWENQTW